MSRDRFVVGVPLGRWQTNCFVVGDRAVGSAVVIDPGENGAEHVPGILEAEGVSCEAILLTHGHIDHFWAMPELARSLDVPVVMHEADRWLWDAPMIGFSGARTNADANEVLERTFGLRWDPPTERLEALSGDASLTYAGLNFDARHTPGHTPGHVTFLGRGLDSAEVRFDRTTQPAADVLFSGDLIFQGSVGRTDLARGDTAALYRSIVDTVLPLEDDTLILSGHGPETTVGAERVRNPFVDEARRLQI
jgi:glyoxylase-like metal-dependent hydrolase (beta-lactamase superfamily II)